MTSGTRRDRLSSVGAPGRRGLARAWVAKDGAFIDGVLADEWAVVDAGGDVRTKEQVLAELTSGELRLDAQRVEDMDVRLFGTSPSCAAAPTPPAPTRESR